MSTKLISIVIGLVSLMIIYIARMIELKTKHDTIRGTIRGCVEESPEVAGF